MNTLNATINELLYHHTLSQILEALANNCAEIAKDISTDKADCWLEAKSAIERLVLTQTIRDAHYLPPFYQE